MAPKAPRDGWRGVSQRLAGQHHLLLQLGRGMVLQICDFRLHCNRKFLDVTTKIQPRWVSVRWVCSASLTKYFEANLLLLLAGLVPGSAHVLAFVQLGDAFDCHLRAILVEAVLIPIFKNDFISGDCYEEEEKKRVK